MGVVLTGVLAVHAATHLLGFVKWSRLAAVPALSGRLLVSLSATGERAFAIGWLAALGLLLAAAVLRVARQEVWWLPALVGVLLSESLIVIAWPDAKAGTVANLIILLAVVEAAAHANFRSRVGREAAALLADAGSDTRTVTPDDLRPLPLPVARWLDVSNARLAVARTPSSRPGSGSAPSGESSKGSRYQRAARSGGNCRPAISCTTDGRSWTSTSTSPLRP